MCALRPFFRKTETPFRHSKAKPPISCGGKAGAFVGENPLKDVERRLKNRLFRHFSTGKAVENSVESVKNCIPGKLYIGLLKKLNLHLDLLGCKAYNKKAYNREMCIHRLTSETRGVSLKYFERRGRPRHAHADSQAQREAGAV